MRSLTVASRDLAARLTTARSWAGAQSARLADRPCRRTATSGVAATSSLSRVSAVPRPWSEALAIVLPGRSRSSISTSFAVASVTFTPAATGRVTADVTASRARSRLRRRARSVAGSSGSPGASAGCTRSAGTSGVVEPLVRGVGGHLDQDPGQCRAIGDRMVEADHHRAEVVSLEDVCPPQRPVEAQRFGEPGLQEGLQGVAAVPAVPAELVDADVVADVEVRDPRPTCRHRPPRRRPPDAS